MGYSGLVHRCKNVQIKFKKNIKNVTEIKKTVVNVIKNVTSSQYSSTPRLIPRPRNGLQGNSEYAIQFSFAEIVVILG